MYRTADIKRSRSTVVTLFLLAVFALAPAACGKDSTTSPPPAPPAPPPPAPPPAPVATRIEVSPQSVSLTTVGQTRQIQSTVYDQNGAVMSGAPVTWSSNNAAVASVNATGLVRAVGNGDAQVTARTGNLSAHVAVTVSQATTRIEINPDEPKLRSIGETVQLVLTRFDSGGNAVTGAADVTWQSSDEAVATVTADGLVTAVGDGAAQITARSGSLTAAATVTVEQQATRIVITPEEHLFTAREETFQFEAEAFDANGHGVEAGGLIWHTSDGRVATVDTTGLVTARGDGTAEISANRDDVSAAATVRVRLPQPERDALIAFYEATGGPEWENDEKWLSNSPLNEWFGVRTNEAGRVQQIDLFLNNLSGTLAPELAQLTELTALYIVGNPVSGPIPPEWAGLSRLKELHLLDNRLTGDIPAELGQLDSLRVLNLGGNELTGPIPADLGNMTSLESLLLNNNQLSGNLPAALGRLANLKALLLNQNPDLTGALPLALAELNLESLNLTGTGLCAPDDPAFQAWFFRFNAGVDNCTPSDPTRSPDQNPLVVFYLETGGADWTDNTNWLSDQPLGEWFGIETDADNRVVSINLEDNGLSGEIPFEFRLLTNLERIDLSNNMLTGDIRPITDLRKLVSVRLNGNIGLTGEVDFSSRYQPDLDELLLHGTQLCAPDDDQFQAWLRGLANSRVTDCMDLWYDRTALREIYDQTDGRNWTQSEGWSSTRHVGAWYGVTTNEDGLVTGLDLSENNLRGTLPGQIQYMPALTHLDLSGNAYLGGPLPAEITRLELDTLLLAGTQYCFSEGDDFQEWLDTIATTSYNTCGVFDDHPDIDALVALYNATNGPEWRERDKWLVHAPLETWHGLTVDAEGRVTGIDLFYNGLKGELPSEIGDLSRLKQLSLESNELTGSIPSEIGRLRNLEYLNLNTNELTGGIPSEIGQLASLDTLMLVKNNLTGGIPPEIGRLADLTFLRLDENTLDGAIPGEIGQLTELTVLMLSENELTGAIPSEIGRLENLTLLDLNSNRISGSLPDALWNLRKLEILRLAQNRLSGTVPSDIVRLSNLKRLDISYNMELTGPLPREMINLKLDELLTSQTMTCVPADEEFQAWLRTVSNKQLTQRCTQ